MRTRLRSGPAILAALVCVAVGVALAIALSPSSKPAFPASVYPPPRAVDAGGLGKCPNDTAIAGGSRAAATGTVRTFLAARSLSRLRQLSDPAWWPQLGTVPLRPSAISTDQLSTAPLTGRHRQLVQTWCGSRTVEATWVVGVCSAGGTFAHCAREHPALVADVFVLSRHGHHLVWLIAGNGS